MDDNSGDKSHEIPLNQVLITGYNIGSMGHKIEIEDNDYEIEIPIANKFDEDDIKSLIEYFSDNPEAQNPDIEDDWRSFIEQEESYSVSSEGLIPEIINYSEGKNNELFAELTVPTQSEGATFTQRGTQAGWSIGGDFVRRTSSKSASKGAVEEQPYEKLVTKFAIYEEFVEIGVTYDDSISSFSNTAQTIRIQLSDITDIHKGGLEGLFGFSFETAADVYQLILMRKGRSKGVAPDDVNEAVNELRQAVENAPTANDGHQQEAREDSSDADAVERLSQIKQLHEDGVLTDDEFQSKKEELLDQI